MSKCSKGCGDINYDACCLLFNLEFEETMDLTLDFGEVIEIQHGFIPYEGPYEATSRAFEEYKLYTKDKNMTDDIIVHEIPYAEVSNTDGTTVIIAS